MKKGGVYGGNTKTGLIFEGKVDLATFLARQAGYEVKNDEDFYKYVKEVDILLYEKDLDEGREYD